MGAMRTMITRTLLFSATLALAPQALAEHGTIEKPADAPSSTVAWTPEVKHALANADAQRGANLSQTMMCASCHGNNGVSWSGQTPPVSTEWNCIVRSRLTAYTAWNVRIRSTSRQTAR